MSPIEDSDVLQSTDCESSSPSACRSSVTIAQPADTASAGERKARGFAMRRVTTDPAVAVSAPKIARSSSVRPAPTRPVMPSRSPARTCSDTLSTIPADSPCTSRATSSRVYETNPACPLRADSPLIASTAASAECSEVCHVPTRMPSRKTVVRSAILATSSSR